MSLSYGQSLREENWHRGPDLCRGFSDNSLNNFGGRDNPIVRKLKLGVKFLSTFICKVKQLEDNSARTLISQTDLSPSFLPGPFVFFKRITSFSKITVSVCNDDNIVHLYSAFTVTLII